MTGSCEEFDRRRESGGFDGEQETLWREHLAGCAVCREQAAADAFLREMSAPPPPELAAGFEGRLQRRLEQRGARHPATGHPATVPRPGRLRPFGLWTLAAYGTAATIASVLILSRLPWHSFTAPPGLGFVLGALALLSPLVLLDRIGIVRPPG